MQHYRRQGLSGYASRDFTREGGPWPIQGVAGIVEPACRLNSS